MTRTNRDAIVVGARCAGSTTAMLLARKGYDVLLVDRAAFPSDTISTHLIHPPGVASLERWGLLDRVVATGCPPIHTYSFDFGPFKIEGSPGTPEHPVAYAPRRTVLDKILLDAAVEAGVEAREEFTVAELIFENDRVVGIRSVKKDGKVTEERARIVIGADGLHSVVAKSVKPEQYNDKPPILAAYYSYWSDVPLNGRFETYVRPERGIAAWPTNDEQSLIIAGWPMAEFAENKKDIEGNFMRTLERVPEFHERVCAGKRQERFVGTAVPNYFRKPYGAGWALVGDAGYNKDFITAQGITDAFRDAEFCADAVHESWSGDSPMEKTMQHYQSKRDGHVLPMYELTTQLATLEPPPPERQKVLHAVHGNKEAMDGFARMNAGVTSPSEFFSEANVEWIMAHAGTK